jgi:hypothetical protein
MKLKIGLRLKPIHDNNIIAEIIDNDNIKHIKTGQELQSEFVELTSTNYLFFKRRQFK